MGRVVGEMPGDDASRTFLGRDIYDWIWPVMTRATLDTRLGRRMREREEGPIEFKRRQEDGAWDEDGSEGVDE